MSRLLVLTLAGALYGQEVAFEVAAIKPVSNAAQGGRILAPQISGGPNTANPNQITYHNVQVITLVTRAFGVRFDEIANPEVLRESSVFDIVANVPAGTTPDQVPLMEQHLLRERFGLRVHRDQRIRQVYFVRVGKGGPKLKESPAAPPNSDAPKSAYTYDEQGFAILPPEFAGTIARPRAGRMMIAGQRAKLSELLHWFQDPLRRPLIDRTGLTGLYDFRVQFTIGTAPIGGPFPTDPIPTARDAIAELGLKLETGEAMVEMLVIDAVNLTPTEN